MRSLIKAKMVKNSSPPSFFAPLQCDFVAPRIQNMKSVSPFESEVAL